MQAPKALNMKSDTENRVKRVLLYSLIVSVILGAALGLFIVLRGEWSWYEVRIVLTTIVIAAGSILGLACDLSKVPCSANLLPRTGMLLTIIATILGLFGIWAESLIDTFEEGYWKSTAITIAFAVATVHVCLLSIAKLAGGFRYVYYIATQVIFGVASLIAAMVLFELDGESFFRPLAALSIIAVALTLIIPLLHRISRSRHSASAYDLATPLEERNLAAIDTEIASLRERIAKLEKLRVELQSG